MADPNDSGTSEQHDALIGQTIAGRYVVESQLGAGGMGAVYKAKQLSMDRPVALKLLHHHFAQNKQAVARFNREMKVTATIEHPNTIRVYDYGQTEQGQLFLAMEYLQGRTLGDVLDAGVPMPAKRLCRIGVQIGKALAAAHSDGVVHRDLKPDNVMLLDRYGEEDVVKVLDFGIARFSDDEQRTQLTAEGAVVGTPAYMSPEQATGVDIGLATDLYSFGVMLFEMATGAVPFDAPTTISLMVKHVQEAPPQPSTIAPGLVAPDLEQLILQLLEKEPGARPASAEEVVSRLENIGGIAPQLLAASTQVGAKPVIKRHQHKTVPESEKSKLGLWIGLGVLAVGGIVAAIVALGGGSSGPDTPATVVVTDLPDVVASSADAGATATSDTFVAAASTDAKAAAAPEVKIGAAGTKTDTTGATAAQPDVTAAVAAVDASKASDATQVAVAAPDTREAAALLAARTAIDAYLDQSGHPHAPEACQTSRSSITDTLRQAADYLKEGVVTGGREADSKALNLLDKQVKAGAQSAEYWALKAQAELQAAGAPEDAIRSAKTAVRLCASWPYAHNVLGNAYQRSGDFKAAVVAYDRAIRDAAYYQAPRFNLGLSQLRLDNTKGAVNTLTALLARKGDHHRARLVRGQALMTLEDFERAAKDIKMAADGLGKNAGAYLLLGQAYTKLKRSTAANAAFCKAKELGDSRADGLCKNP